jgi:hypothetical protein
MTPQEAIQIIDNVCSQVSLNRESHVKVQEAIKVLNNLIPKEEEK